jgi:hypothetical protein
MLVFVDESGDTGRKLERGSSSHLTVALVVFRNHDEALRCDDRIVRLRAELKKPSTFEFHFSHNSDRIRLAFLEAIAPCDFTYHAVSLNKDPAKLWGKGFQFKESLYKYTCRLVFENAKPFLDHATVVIDGSGERRFRQELQAYLKARMNEPSGRTAIAKVKIQRSTSNNLLQLADYVAGVVNRQVQRKPRATEFQRWIAVRQSSLRVWP